MKSSHIFMAVSLLMCASACSSDDPKDSPDEPQGGNKPNVETPTASVAEINTQRAITIINAAVENYFDGQSRKMSRKFNPFTGNKSSEIGSVWMYTSSIEAVNAAMTAMKDLKDSGKPELYNTNWESYKALLEKLIDNLDYYAGTFTLT
ncbi:MAG: hydrolase, partial [Muribaculaceae bacterium]|nr:hydrolase [Muribaculaceae bacterium]